MFKNNIESLFQYFMFNDVEIISKSFFKPSFQTSNCRNKKVESRSMSIGNLAENWDFWTKSFSTWITFLFLNTHSAKWTTFYSRYRKAFKWKSFKLRDIKLENDLTFFVDTR